MAIDELDEQLLVQAYQAGDQRAFDAIVRTQWRALYAHAMRRLSDHESAEDAVQDTLLRAYRALPKLTGDLALRAWLHRILTNVCHDEGNRRRRDAGLVERVSALPIVDVADPVDEAVLHDTVRVMSSALQGLPETYREALVLRYVDGLSFREVGEVVGITEENARARVHRGRRALHRVLSSIAVLVAFLVPGLRRAQPTAPAAPDPSAAEPVSLVAQLTSHAMTAAPTVTRVASEVSALPSGKSALLTGAIAAAAAVSVPVAAYTVREVTTPNAPPAAVAAPLDDEAGGSVDVDDPVVVPGEVGPDASTSTVPSEDASTSTTLSPSALHPFEDDDATTSTTTPSDSTTSTTFVTSPSDVVAQVLGGQLTVTGELPNYDLAGTLTISGDDTSTGELTGRLSVYDDDSMAAELTIDVGGEQYSLRIRGALTSREESDGTPQYAFVGRFSLPNGGELGAPDEGDVVEGTFRAASDGWSSLSLDLSGSDR